MSKDTLEQKKNKFVETGGLRCFHCGSEELDSSSKESSDAGIVVSVTCEDCNKEWKELYTLSAVVD